MRFTGVLLSLLFLAAPVRGRHGYWENVAPMPVGETSQSALVLADGTVLATGGEATGYGLPTHTVERYDAATETWTLEASMLRARIGHTETLLPDGRVLVAGGLGHKLQPLSSAEIYDPARNTWTATSPMPGTRFSQSASLLSNGLVLVVGGIMNGAISKTTLLFNPADGTWQFGPPTVYPHAQQGSVSLPDGRILIAGGYGGPPEMYDPVRRTWTTLANPGFRTHPVLALLGNGEVLLATGVGHAGRALLSAKTFDPATSRWRQTASLSTARDTPIGVELLDGRVLVAGGGGPHLRMLRSAEVYSPSSARWQVTGSLHHARSAATAVVLRGGSVLVCGGSWFGTVLASCELYHP